MVDVPSDVGSLVLWKGEISSVREMTGGRYVEGVEDRGCLENVNWSLEGSVYEWKRRRGHGGQVARY